MILNSLKRSRIINTCLWVGFSVGLQALFVFMFFTCTHYMIAQNITVPKFISII